MKVIAGWTILYQLSFAVITNLVESALRNDQCSFWDWENDMWCQNEKSPRKTFTLFYKSHIYELSINLSMAQTQIGLSALSNTIHSISAKMHLIWRYLLLPEGQFGDQMPSPFSNWKQTCSKEGIIKLRTRYRKQLPYYLLKSFLIVIIDSANT